MKLHVDFLNMVVKNEKGLVVEPKRFNLGKVKEEIIAALDSFAKIEHNAREFFAKCPDYNAFLTTVNAEHKDCIPYWNNQFYLSYYVLMFQQADSSFVRNLIESDILWTYYDDLEAKNYKAKIRYHETYFELKQQSIQSLYDNLNHELLVSSK